MREKNKKCLKVKLEKKGFTMIELLVVIIILGVVVSIGGYSIVSIINNSHEKQYKMSISILEKAAEGYFVEEDVDWLEDNFVDYYYQCVDVKELINVGYFKNELLETKVSKDRNFKPGDKVKVLRDKVSHSIISSQFLFEDSNGFCDVLSETNTPDVTANVDMRWEEPGKSILLSYELSSNVSEEALFNYNYSYQIVDKADPVNATFTENIIEFVVPISETVEIYATIKRGDEIFAEKKEKFVVEITDNEEEIEEEEIVGEVDSNPPILKILPHLEYLSTSANGKEITIRAYDNESGLKVKTHTINYLFTNEEISSCETLISNSSSSSVNLNVSAGNEFATYDVTINVPNIQLTTPSNLKLYVCSNNLEDNDGNIFNDIVKDELNIYDLEETTSTALFYLPSVLSCDGDTCTLGTGTNFFANGVSLSAGTKFYYLWSQPMNLFKMMGFDLQFVGAYVAFDDLKKLSSFTTEHYNEAINNAEVIIDDGIGTQYVFGYIPLSNMGMCLTTIPCK